MEICKVFLETNIHMCKTFSFSATVKTGKTMADNDINSWCGFVSCHFRKFNLYIFRHLSHLTSCRDELGWFTISKFQQVLCHIEGLSCEKAPPYLGNC